MAKRAPARDEREEDRSDEREAQPTEDAPPPTRVPAFHAHDPCRILGDVLTTLALFALTKSTATLDRTVIEKTIEGHFEEVTSCYQSGLERNAELAGTVTVRLAIS